MFSEETCRALRLLLAYASMLGVFLIEWFHQGSAKNLEIILPATIGAYHLGEYYTNKEEHRDEQQN